MLPEIKLVITQNDKVKQDITEKVDTSNFVKTIEALQEMANAVLTKMIDEFDGPGDCLDESENESDPDEDVCTSSKKKKK